MSDVTLSDSPASAPAKGGRDHLLAGLVTFIASLLLVALTGAWSSKESVKDHEADISAIRADIARTLDVLCEIKPTARRCHERDQAAAP